MEQQAQSHAQELKIDQAHLFRNAFDAAANGIAIEDLEGRPLFANPALCAMLGFSEEEMRQRHCVEFSPAEDAKLDWALFEQLRQGSIDKYHLEKRFFRKDGSLFWGRLSISLMSSPVGTAPLVVAIVEDISEKKTAEERLQRSQADLQHLASRLIQVQEEERQRIGRDLHDDIGQRLTLLVVGLEQLRESLAAGQNAQVQLASELQSKADEVATDLQDISRALHSAKLQFLGLQIALQNLCDKVSAQQHIPVTLHADELPASLPTGMELCIYRVAQEALNNIVKHSRSAVAVIEVTHAEGTMFLKVRDTGVGFDTSISHKGIGLSSMRERLRTFGGELFVESLPGIGTTITASVKLEKARTAASA